MNTKSLIGQIWQCENGGIYLISSQEKQKDHLSLAKEQFKVGGWLDWREFDEHGRNNKYSMFNLDTYIGTVNEGNEWNVKIDKEGGEYTISGGQAEVWKLYEVVKDESTDLEGKIVFRIPSNHYMLHFVDLKSKKARSYNWNSCIKITLKPFYGKITIESTKGVEK